MLPRHNQLMKILYLAHSRIPSASANSIQVMHMCRALGRRHETILLGRGPQNHGASPDSIFDFYGLSKSFEIIFPPKNRFQTLDSINSYIHLIRILRQTKPDLCLGRHLKSLYLAVKMGFKVVYEAHEIPKSRMEKLIIRRICSARGFAGMVFISKMLQEKYLSIFPDLSRDRVVVAHDGISIDYMDSIKPLEGPLPGRTGSFRAGYAGGLRPEKGISLILDVAKLLPEIDFHLVGGSKDEILFWQSKAQGMTNVFFHGHVEPWKAVQYQKSCDVLLAPYQLLSWTRENGRLEITRDQKRFIGNSPLKYFEYMASQKPIVTSDIPIAREVFTHGHDALLLEENPAKWAKGIAMLEQDRDMAQKLSQNAGKRVLDFTWDKRAAKILSGLPELAILQKKFCEGLRTED